MTIGYKTVGSPNAATEGNPRHHIRTSWNGADSLIKRYEAHPVKRADGSTRYVTRWYEVSPPAEGPRTVSATGLIAEALRLRDQHEATLSENAGPRALPYNPGWRPGRPPKRARLQENPYTKWWAVLNSTVHHWSSQIITPGCPGDPVAYVTDVMDWRGWNNVTTEPWSANDDLKLIERLRGKMHGTQFNPAIFLGEGHQALDLIASSARRIAESLFRLKRGDFLGAAKALRPSAGRDPQFVRPDRLKALSGSLRALARRDTATGIAARLGITQREALRAMAALDRGRRMPRGINRDSLIRARREASTEVRLDVSAPQEFSSGWLELQYGWLPLLSDAEEGAQFLAHQLNSPLQTTFRASVTIRATYSRATLWEECPKVGKGTGPGRQVYRKSLIARVKEKSTIPKLLGLTTLESVAWELTPWSFVIDWFIPIGDWLAARGHAQGLTGTFITTVKNSSTALEPYGDFTIPAGEAYPWERNFFENGGTTRSVSTTLHVPMPVTKPLSKALSWRHCVNAVALLVSGHGGQGYK